MDAILEQVNSMGNAFVDFALPMLIQSSVLILVLLALDLALRKRVRAVFRYWIWMIVLLKLVLPTTLSSPISPAYWLGNELHSIIPQKPFAAGEALVMSSADEIPMLTPASAGQESPPASPTRAASSTLSMTWQGYVFLAWLAAVLVMVILLIHRAFFVRRLIAESAEASEELLPILERAREKMGIRRPTALRLSSTAVSPSVCGLLQPTILIPQSLPAEIDPRHMKSILMHELAHIKRADLWINSLQAIVQIIYIYNPLLWVANAIIRKVREQAVDEMVLVAMGDDAEDYPRTLLNISRLAFGSPALSLRLIGVVESKKALIGRIKHITSRPFPTSAKLGIGSLMVIFALSVGLLPMARAERTSKSATGVATADIEVSGMSLRKAAADGDLEQVKSLLAKGLDVDAKGWRGRTPLHRAAEQGHKNVVEFLIAEGASVNASDNGDATPVWLAMAGNHKDIVELLVQEGANVPPIEFAACFGDTDRVRELIRDGVDVNTKGENKGRTALHWAATGNSMDTVELLLDKGANVNIADKDKLTPLHLAALRARKDVVETLLAAGADVNSRNERWNSTPLHDATIPGDMGVITLLVEKGADINIMDIYGKTPLHNAVEFNRPEAVKFFLARGADVNQKRGEGYESTPLHNAASNGNKDMIELLLANGADLKAKRYGETALHRAIMADKKDMVRFLLAKGLKTSAINKAAFFGELDKVKTLLARGTDINSTDECGYCPLHCAVRGNQRKIAQFLIAKGANVNAKDIRNFTALHDASATGQEDITEMLIAKGADVNARAMNDATALYWAAYQGHKEIVELLIARGAEMESRQYDGQTPLQIACRNGHKDVAEFLIARGADVTSRNDDGHTPLSLAKRDNRTDVIELLRKHGAKE